MPQPRVSTVEYRGPDRRRHVDGSELRALRPAGAVALIAIAWTTAAALLGDGAPTSTGRLSGRLEVAGAALAILAGGICVLRRHLEGSAPSLWLGLGLLVLGFPGLALAEPGQRGDEATAAVLAALWVAAALLALALRSPDIDGSLSPVLVAGATAGGIVIAFVATSIVVVKGPAAPVGVATGLAYLGLAAATLARLRRRGFPEGGWLVTVLVALGAAVIMRWVAPSATGLMGLGASLLRCTAFGLAAAGSVGVLSVSASRHRASAFRSRLEYADEAELRRHLVEEYAERLHEVRSSVLALHGGVRNLEPAAETDARLTAALEAELLRLRDLVSPGEPEVDGIHFQVADALVPTLQVCAAGGWPVAWDLPAGLGAIGRPARCAQVVHALVANAHRHAAGTPIDVSASRVGDHLAIRVEDRGPGVARNRREQIFERGFQSHPDLGGHGLGLAIARRLVREQGGDLWVEPRPGGGAAFVMLLDAAPAADEPLQLRVV